MRVDPSAMKTKKARSVRVEHVIAWLVAFLRRPPFVVVADSLRQRLEARLREFRSGHISRAGLWLSLGVEFAWALVQFYIFVHRL